MAQPILAAQDPQVATAIDQELERQRSMTNSTEIE